MNYPPHLREVFEKLKNGYHISPEDDVLYSALNSERYEDYADYFAGLGITLRKHEHDFYYFEPEAEDKNSPRLAKIAVFSFILIDHIANRGLPVEPTIFADSFTMRGLPHFSTLDSYRSRLEQVGVMDYADLREVINHLKNVGWAKWVGDDEFRFLRPFHRLLSKCLELAQQSGQNANEASPILNQGLAQKHESENESHA
ncbi:MAG: hypothetical protein ABSB84_02120 [Verrucomicrobiota bacterium]|jgi:hypothetical protein